MCLINKQKTQLLFQSHFISTANSTLLCQDLLGFDQLGSFTSYAAWHFTGVVGKVGVAGGVGYSSATSEISQSERLWEESV